MNRQLNLIANPLKELKLDGQPLKKKRMQYIFYYVQWITFWVGNILQLELTIIT